MDENAAKRRRGADGVVFPLRTAVPFFFGGGNATRLNTLMGYLQDVRRSGTAIGPRPLRRGRLPPRCT